MHIFPFVVFALKEHVFYLADELRPIIYFLRQYRNSVQDQILFITNIL